MIKKIVIALCDENVKSLVRDCLGIICKGIETDECLTEAELYRCVENSGEALVVLDKYFFGYVICYKLLKLKVCNRKLRLCFLEQGDCSRYFGLRLYDNGVKAFITNVEDAEHLKKELMKVLGGAGSLPDEIQSSIESSDYLLDRKCFTEITEKELVVGLYLGEGKSQKEICYITGMSQQSVTLHVHRLKRKIGYKKPADYAILNRRAYC